MIAASVSARNVVHSNRTQATYLWQSNPCLGALDVAFVDCLSVPTGYV